MNPARAAEDNMNVQLKDITVTARDGRVSHLDQVYIRGSHVRFFIVPDMLRCVKWFSRCFTIGLEEFCSRRHRISAGADMATGIGMRLCSDREAREVVVLVWREEGRRSTGREGKEEVEDEKGSVIW